MNSTYYPQEISAPSGFSVAPGRPRCDSSITARVLRNRSGPRKRPRGRRRKGKGLRIWTGPAEDEGRRPGNQRLFRKAGEERGGMPERAVEASQDTEAAGRARSSIQPGGDGSQEPEQHGRGGSSEPNSSGRRQTCKDRVRASGAFFRFSATASPTRRSCIRNEKRDPSHGPGPAVKHALPRPCICKRDRTPRPVSDQQHVVGEAAIRPTFYRCCINIVWRGKMRRRPACSDSPC